MSRSYGKYRRKGKVSKRGRPKKKTVFPKKVKLNEMVIDTSDYDEEYEETKQQRILDSEQIQRDIAKSTLLVEDDDELQETQIQQIIKKRNQSKPELLEDLLSNQESDADSLLDKTTQKEKSDVKPMTEKQRNEYIDEYNKILKQMTSRFKELITIMISLSREYWDIIYKQTTVDANKISNKYSEYGLDAPKDAIALRTLQYQRANVMNLNRGMQSLRESSESSLAGGASISQRIGYELSNILYEVLNTGEGLKENFFSAPDSQDYFVQSPYSRQ